MMRLLLSTALLLAGASAHNDLLLQTLPKCWQDCFKSTGDGCATSSCICSASNASDSYLSSAISCAVSKCKADEWALDIALGSLELYCSATGRAIPDNAIDKAYDAAGGNNGPSPNPSTPPSAPPTPPKPSNAKTTKPSDDAPHDLTSTIHSTLTRTTTENGNTLQVVIPIYIGPSGMATGGASTSTITAPASSAAAPSSATPSPAPSVVSHSSGPAQPTTVTSAAGSQATRRPNSNGSPFDNMQAGATSWAVSTPLLGLGFIALIFARF